ncbi:glutamate-rich WD repeat-containing protein 1 [Dorcoceras hygrometricum]|uniref:Glutamate-rich WD repeat-containing protein 1 n=1 Tax=Dorcoceras hygrometricum TaxID=472368 RepID=A0A2Z7B505_9LAMI|nr:glutamate-rich WD repeat-containing protein 1 [Dorcoceras hygrometricum]
MVLGTKKTISNSYICPADGSHYNQSAVGLVFMEWAAGLAMETSKVESAVPGRLCVDNQSQDPVASYSGSRRKQQQHPVESLYESAVAMNTVASSMHPVASFVSHTVAAVVHLWNLGVLTAAGCGIGSVHAVVRSNLLVEPSEVFRNKEEYQQEEDSCAKKRSSYICPAVGSQYTDSAVGLVFMESAVELATETSRVDSVVRNQARAKLNQLVHSRSDEPAGTMTTNCKLAIISTVDESINSRYPRSKEESQAGAGTMKKSAGALSVDEEATVE